MRKNTCQIFNSLLTDSNHLQPNGKLKPQKKRYPDQFQLSFIDLIGEVSANAK